MRHYAADAANLNPACIYNAWRMEAFIYSHYKKEYKIGLSLVTYVNNIVLINLAIANMSTSRICIIRGMNATPVARLDWGWGPRLNWSPYELPREIRRKAVENFANLCEITSRSRTCVSYCYSTIFHCTVSEILNVNFRTTACPWNLC